MKCPNQCLSVFVLITIIEISSALYSPLVIFGTSDWNNMQQQVQKQDFTAPVLIPRVFTRNSFSVNNAINKGSTSFRTNSDVCKESTGQFADPSYCDKYYDCWDGRPVSSGQCSHGLMFNEHTSSCDYPMNVDCNGKQVSKPLQDVDQGCEQPYGTFANPNNCTQFAVCHAGTATYYTCEEGLAYDKELGVCTQPQDPSCLQPSQPPPTDTADEGQGIPELPLDPDNFKPIPPSGPGGSGNDNGGSIVFPIIPGSPQATKCPTGSSGFLPVAKDCQSVIVCIKGSGYLLSCPKGNYYYPPEARCKPGRSESCEQMNPPPLTIDNVKYAYLRSGYPLLPNGIYF